VPKKSRKPPAKPKRKRQPNQYPLGGNSFRISMARRMFAAGASYGEVRTAIVERYSVHKTTAEKDIIEARRRNEELTNRAVPDLIARNSIRLDALVDIAEEKGDVVGATGALREFHRIHGMHAPKKVQVTGHVAIALDIQAVVAVLDDVGLAALETVLAQIEAAKARGDLALPAPEDKSDDDDADELDRN
jgi:hypothetical protein